jgi:hypothetical protein
MSETRTFIETFLNFDDAVLWADQHLREHAETEFHLVECLIRYVNYQYQVRVSFERN